MMHMPLLLAALIVLSGCGPLDYYSGRNMGFYHAG